MADAMHPAAPHHLPPFITAPGQTDVFLVGCAIFLVVAVITLGSLYFRLHALPEHLSHGKASKLQFEVVSVMALLALFTHNSWFWVAALLLAIIPVPDLYGQLERMADSLAKMAHWPGRRGAAAPEPAIATAPLIVPKTHRGSREQPRPKLIDRPDLELTAVDPSTPAAPLVERPPQSDPLARRPLPHRGERER